MENQELNKANILIRLLKENHISDEEFKFLYPENEQVFIPWNQVEYVPEDPLYKNGFIHMVNPDWLPTYTAPFNSNGWYLHSDGSVTNSNERKLKDR